MAASVSASSSPSAGAFASALLAWATSGQGRSGLPWQPTAQSPADPYAVWVSEVMLQQTQVKTMLPFFERFMARFPSVEHLAMAPLEEVLAHWSGLGYYARARNLHRAAQQVRLQGRWPTTRSAWETLPGVGRSTAAAVVSICFGQREAILDGNVRRVLARQVGALEPWGTPALANRLWPEAEARLPPQGPEMPRYTQALMDLGATVCLPRQPACDRCPVRHLCLAAATGRQSEFPTPAPRRVRPARQEHWALQVREGREVCLVERVATGVWGGLWSLPILMEPPPGAALWASLRHDFTHFQLHVQVWEVALANGLAEGGFWVSRDRALAGPLPAPVRRVLEGL